MSKILYCIWGQLRGVDTCAASQVEHLYSKENVDLMICCNCPTPEDVPRDYERSKAYGPTIDTHFYSKTLQEIKDEINVHIDFKPNYPKKNMHYKVQKNRDGSQQVIWRDNFESVSEKGKVSLNNIFSRSGLYITYSHSQLLKRLKNVDLLPYSHVVLLRSDLLFLHDMIDISLLHKRKLYTFKGHEKGKWWGGLNNLLTICPKRLIFPYIETISTNIYSSYDCRWYSNKIENKIGLNYERTCLNALKKAKLFVTYINCNIYYITYDVNDTTTWYPHEIDKNNVRYKYKSLYDDCISYKNINFKYINHPNGYIDIIKENKLV